MGDKVTIVLSVLVAGTLVQTVDRLQAGREDSAALDARTPVWKVTVRTAIDDWVVLWWPRDELVDIYYIDRRLSPSQPCCSRTQNWPRLTGFRWALTCT